MKQSELKRCYDIEMGRYVKKAYLWRRYSRCFQNDWQKGVWKDGKRSC